MSIKSRPACKKRCQVHRQLDLITVFIDYSARRSSYLTEWSCSQMGCVSTSNRRCPADWFVDCVGNVWAAMKLVLGLGCGPNLITWAGTTYSFEQNFQMTDLILIRASCPSSMRTVMEVHTRRESTTVCINLEKPICLWSTRISSVCLSVLQFVWVRVEVTLKLHIIRLSFQTPTDPRALLAYILSLSGIHYKRAASGFSASTIPDSCWLTAWAAVFPDVVRKYHDEILGAASWITLLRS